MLLRCLSAAVLIITGTFSCVNSGSNAFLAFNDSLTIPKDSATMFFRTKDKLKDTVFDNNSISHFENKWYSNMLFAVREPVPYNYTGPFDIYRFTWLRSFHKPFSFRIERKGSNAFLIVTEASGAGGYSPGKIVLDTTIRVTHNEWN